MSTPLWVTTTRGTSVGTATIEADDETFTITAHGLVNGQQVTVATLTGGAVGVLVVDAPYFVASVATNTFQLRPAPGAPVMTFTSDGGCAVYQTAGIFDGQTLRDAMSGLIAKGGDFNGGFQARGGVFPNGSVSGHVSVSGMTWSTVKIVASVTHSTGGVYTVAHDVDSGSITGADPSQPRIDALDLQIQDHALDASGFARGRIVYTAGTPAAIPVAPGSTANAERIATISVPAGSTTPTILTLPRITTARGGVIPVADSTAYPTTGGRYEGMVLWDSSLDQLVVNMNNGSTWSAVASANGYQYWQTVSFTSSGSFTKASYPGLRAVRIYCQGGGGAGGGGAITGAGSASSGGGGQGGNYAEKWALASALAASETVTIGAGGTGVAGTTGNNGGTTSVGALCSASGGAGGQTSSSTTTWGTPISATPITTATGDLIALGSPGTFGLVNGTSDFALSGAGGSSMWGIGGRPVQSASGAAGFAASGYGGGGGGGGNSNSQGTAVAGGAGAPGRVLIDLYL